MSTVAFPQGVFGGSGVPQFQKLSSSNTATDKSIHIQSDAALFFSVSIEGGFAGQVVSPDGFGNPYTANGFLIPNPYPTMAYIEVYDKTTFQFLGGSDVMLTGGDVFKIRITYRTYVPIANGYIGVMLNGNRQIVRGEDYQRLAENNDVIPRGSGD